MRLYLAEMVPTIYEDALAHPALFHWFGRVAAEFEPWLEALPLPIHPGLVEFWRRTGGGDLFESETILGPLITEDYDNVLKTNEYEWSKGLPEDMLVFHIGWNVSASFVDRTLHRTRIVCFRPRSYNVAETYDTFNAWYQGNLRSVYAERYGLQQF